MWNSPYVLWPGRLWLITCDSHLTIGSSDKLHEITPELQQIILPTSTGRTQINRMLHKESHQLFIGIEFEEKKRGIQMNHI